MKNTHFNFFFILLELNMPFFSGFISHLFEKIFFGFDFFFFLSCWYIGIADELMCAFVLVSLGSTLKGVIIIQRLSNTVILIHAFEKKKKK